VKLDMATSQQPPEIPSTGATGGRRGKRSFWSGDRAAIAQTILIAVLILLLVGFIVDNTRRVRVSFIFFHLTGSLIWILLITAVVGFVAGWLVHAKRVAGSSKKK
jgi:uncharacterized integral membrane protein